MTMTKVFEDTLKLNDTDALNLARKLYNSIQSGNALSSDGQQQIKALAQHKFVDAAFYAVRAIRQQPDVSIYYYDLVVAAGHKNNYVVVELALRVLEDKNFDSPDYQAILAKSTLHTDSNISYIAARTISKKDDKTPYLSALTEIQNYPDRFDDEVVNIANEILENLTAQDAAATQMLKNVLVTPLDEQKIANDNDTSISEMTFDAKISYIPPEDNDSDICNKFNDATISLTTNKMSPYNVDCKRLLKEGIEIAALEVDPASLTATYLNPVIH